METENQKEEKMGKIYTIEEIRKMAGTNDLYITKRGYIYKIVDGKKIYVRNK